MISVIFLKILSKRESDKYQILSCKNIASNSLLRKAPMPLDSHTHYAYNIDGGGEMRFIELDRLLRKNGWYVVRTKGSHYQYQRDGVSKTLTVPNHPGDIAAIIVKNILKGAGIRP